MRGPGRRRTAGAVVLGLVLGSAGEADRALQGQELSRRPSADHVKAVDFLDRHPELASRVRDLGLEPDFALAIVFPELLRYSPLADIVQVGYLQTLYVSLGRRYGHVSVGRFQMKPAFAETLEADFNRRLGRAERERIAGGAFDLADTAENRLARVRRLVRLDGQVTYLAIFVRVMETLHPRLPWPGVEEKLRIFATAYNSGYRQGLERLRELSSVPRYRLGDGEAGPNASYADLAVDYYRRASARR